jgi:predicted small lipoprotein YifL
MKKFALLMTLALAACGGPLKYQPATTARAPGADCKVVADVNKDTHVTRLNIKFEHLPPPGRIQEGTTIFIAWQRRESNGPWVRIGTLKFDEGTREGSIEEATVPEVAFDVMVTAEEKLDIPNPSAHVVMEQKINK